MVTQDPVLFAGSIRDNLTYGCHDADEERVFEAARQAGVHDFVARLPEAYETHIGESGVFLSGGGQAFHRGAGGPHRPAALPAVSPVGSVLAAAGRAVHQHTLSPYFPVPSISAACRLVASVTDRPPSMRAISSVRSGPFRRSTATLVLPLREDLEIL